MSYCDYNFYKTEYLGNVIAEADFPRLIDRASDKLDYITSCRLIDNFPQDERTAMKVKKAVCALAEFIGDSEKVMSNYRLNGGAVKAISSGSESITFADAKSKKDFDKEMFDVVKDYLADTGLLYIGI